MLNNIKPEDLISWYNKNVGKAYLRQSGYRPSFHIIDCTDLELMNSPMLRAGDTILFDRAFIDGLTISRLKRNM